MNSIFIFCILINMLYVAIEAGVGFYENSLGLLSDAGHNLGDIFSLALALFAFKLARIPSTERYTYGYKKGSILIALVNAVILLVAVGAIVIESFHKFKNPTEMDGSVISWTAGVGIVVNGLTAWMLMKNQKHDINVRGAFLHMVADTLVSVGVVIAGIVIVLTGWTLIDPILSLVVAVVILLSTSKLLLESLRLSMDGVPEGVDSKKIVAAMKRHENVASIHHLHIWPLSTTDVALTAHIVLNDLDQLETTKHDLKKRLAELGIGHVTLEMETHHSHCLEQQCSM